MFCSDRVMLYIITTDKLPNFICRRYIYCLAAVYILRFKVPLPENRHSFLRRVFLWAQQCSAMATVNIYSRHGFVCFCLKTLLSTLEWFPSIVINAPRIGHEELIHTGTWNVSSLRSHSPRGNKEVEFVEGGEARFQ
ncbi:hypothetical protein ILYODFUR_027689 [Ilyodon furcidens]|uniref:Uncharacterized protein n=1 Tax=Ilyodon furcidens TaxID=33524 RepID=A0ABV0T2Z9_9TELE